MEQGRINFRLQNAVAKVVDREITESNLACG